MYTVASWNFRDIAMIFLLFLVRNNYFVGRGLAGN